MWIYGLVALAGTQFLHAVFGGWRRHGQLGLAKALMIGAVVFVSSWLLLTPLLTLAAWAFWLGDTRSWESAPIVSGVAAAGFALLVFGRLILNRSNNVYANVQLALSLTAMIAIGGIHLSHTLSRVDGWTADEAVNNIVRTNPGFEDAKIELVDSRSDLRRYRVLLDGEQRATVSVRSVAFGLGWGRGSSSWRGRAVDDLTKLRELAATRQYYQDPINLRNSLEQFTREHPDTPEAEEAMQWLADIMPEVARIEKAKELGGRLFLLKRLPQLMQENTGKPVDLTREQQIAVELFRLIEAEDLRLYYGRFTCAHRGEAVSALREVGAIEAADWLTEANRLVEPFLNETGTKIRPEARDNASRVVLRQVPHLAEFADDIRNRLIIYCDDHSSHFPTLRGEAHTP